MVCQCCDGFDGFAPIGNGGCGCGCNGFAGFGDAEPVEPITNWNFRFRASGLKDGINPAIPGGVVTSWIDEIQGAVLVRPAAPLGTVQAVAWQNSLAMLRVDSKLEAQVTPTYAAVTERTWLFALRVPTVIPPGNGPSSTWNDPQKNYPLIFKPGVAPGSMILASQPIASNCDAAVDVVAWLGLDAVIVVQQGGGLAPRFSCWVDGIGPVQFSATTSEDPAAVNLGLAAGGWFGVGGEYDYPIAQIAEIDRRLANVEADTEAAFVATSFYGMSV